MINRLNDLDQSNTETLIVRSVSPLKTFTDNLDICLNNINRVLAQFKELNYHDTNIKSKILGINTNYYAAVKEYNTCYEKLVSTKIRAADLQIRNNFIMYYREKLEYCMGDFSKYTDKYKEFTENTVRRHQIVFGDENISHDDIESGNVYTKAITSSLLSDKLRDVQESHMEIIKLEQSITELAQLFSDMSILVANQQPILDNIEEEVTLAEVNISQGNSSLETAKRIAKKNRKLMCCIVCSLVILLIIVLSILRIFIPF
jgi:syntaxin 1B/2/3